MDTLSPYARSQALQTQFAIRSPRSGCHKRTMDGLAVLRGQAEGCECWPTCGSDLLQTCGVVYRACGAGRLGVHCETGITKTLRKTCCRANKLLGKQLQREAKTTPRIERSFC